ncbi:MAG TPA: plasmid stabilization protein [Gammaproteobacteria bacterium]|nr:plasmid stabilization protein [Gammaproteobacteria bacterium]
MSYQITYSDSYVKRAGKFLRKHPDIHNQYRKTLALLALDPWYPSLRLHGFEGRLKDLSSVSINKHYRIVLELDTINEKIILTDVGDHDQVYY